MNLYVKVSLSIVGVFIGGFTTAYQANPAARAIVWVMAGLVPVGGYLIGFYQVNPANQKPEGT